MGEEKKEIKILGLPLFEFIGLAAFVFTLLMICLLRLIRDNANNIDAIKGAVITEFIFCLFGLAYIPLALLPKLQKKDAAVRDWIYYGLVSFVDLLFFIFAIVNLVAIS